MRKRNHFIEKFSTGSEFHEDVFFSLPIIEISGENRVLIENHLGVREYGREKISINMKYGFVDICGVQLELREMTKEQLVISGVIHNISLVRRNKK